MLTSLKICAAQPEHVDMAVWLKIISEEIRNRLKGTARAQVSSKMIVMEYSVPPTNVVCFAGFENLSLLIGRQTKPVGSQIRHVTANGRR